MVNEVQIFKGIKFNNFYFYLTLVHTDTFYTGTFAVYVRAHKTFRHAPTKSNVK